MNERADFTNSDADLTTSAQPESADEAEKIPGSLRIIIKAAAEEYDILDEEIPALLEQVLKQWQVPPSEPETGEIPVEVEQEPENFVEAMLVHLAEHPRFSPQHVEAYRRELEEAVRETLIPEEPEADRPTGEFEQNTQEVDVTEIKRRRIRRKVREAVKSEPPGPSDEYVRKVYQFLIAWSSEKMRAAISIARLGKVIEAIAEKKRRSVPRPGKRTEKDSIPATFTQVEITIMTWEAEKRITLKELKAIAEQEKGYAKNPEALQTRIAQKILEGNLSIWQLYEILEGLESSVDSKNNSIQATAAILEVLTYKRRGWFTRERMEILRPALADAQRQREEADIKNLKDRLRVELSKEPPLNRPSPDESGQNTIP